MRHRRPVCVPHSSPSAFTSPRFEKSAGCAVRTNRNDNFFPAPGAHSFVRGAGTIFINPAIHVTTSKINAEKPFRLGFPVQRPPVHRKYAPVIMTGTTFFLKCIARRFRGPGTGRNILVRCTPAASMISRPTRPRENNECKPRQALAGQYGKIRGDARRRA